MRSLIINLGSRPAASAPSSPLDQMHSFTFETFAVTPNLSYYSRLYVGYMASWSFDLVAGFQSDMRPGSWGNRSLEQRSERSWESSYSAFLLVMKGRFAVRWESDLTVAPPQSMLARFSLRAEGQSNLTSSSLERSLQPRFWRREDESVASERWFH